MPDGDPAPQHRDDNAPDRYEIRRKIGWGGIGAVYAALDLHLGREVAIKRLLAFGGPEDTAGIGRDLLREAHTLSTFQHPNIVTIFDCGIDGDGPFIVMELLRGETIDQTVARAALTLDDFARFAEQVLDGLIAAHSRDVLHRDLKPSNVYVTWLPTGEFQVKLLDFGLAKRSVKPSLQTMDQARSILGSVYFMAPEQFERKPLGFQSDLYSLGCLFFFALTGAFPFDGETFAEIMEAHFANRPEDLAALRPDLPATLCAWALWHLNLDPSDRPASAARSLEVLREVLAGGALPAGSRVPATAPPTGVDAPEPRPTRQAPAPDRGVTTATVPMLVPGSGRPTPQTATQAYLARAQNPPGEGKRRGPTRAGWAVGAGLVAGLALAGLAAVMLTRERDDATPPPPAPEPGAAAAFAPPMEGRLIVWLAAGTATATGPGGAPLAIGDPIARWDDLAPVVGGNNPARSRDVTGAETAPETWPKLAATGPGAGLVRVEPVVRFAGGDSLLVASGDADHPGGLTVIVVLRRAGSGDGSVVWEALHENGEPGLRLRFVGNALAFETADGAASARVETGAGRFTVLAAQWDRQSDPPTLTLAAGGAGSAETSQTVDAPSDLPAVTAIRMGTPRDPDAPPFQGDVAVLLIYAGALSADERARVNEALHTHYFTEPAPQ